MKEAPNLLDFHETASMKLPMELDLKNFQGHKSTLFQMVLDHLVIFLSYSIVL